MRLKNEIEILKSEDTPHLVVENFKIKVVWYLVEEQPVLFVL